MNESNTGAAAIAKVVAGQAASQIAPDLSDLHKAHIRVVALQRNINALALQHRDMQQELSRAEAEFQALRQKIQQETGLVYNDQTLTLEPKGK
jgi:predicted  nucleic acid-binding Zn-ribbon protein